MTDSVSCSECGQYVNSIDPTAPMSESQTHVFLESVCEPVVRVCGGCALQIVRLHLTREGKLSKIK